MSSNPLTPPNPTPSSSPTGTPGSASTLARPVAVVTGASRGIGAAIAKALAQDGYYTVVNYASSEGPAQKVLDDIRAQGGCGELCGFNVADPDQVDEKLEALAKRQGPVQVLVNNAGITIDGLLVRIKNSDLDQTLSVDLKGAIYCTRAAAKQMMRARSGSIIQIASVVGESGNAGQSAYAAAKAGLIGFSKSVALELASRGVRVNVVSPGFITTDMTGALTEAQKEAILRNVPLGFFGVAEDVASVVSFLASPKSRYITGQVIGVNGGMYL
jgi:3-oxoacyl-[acyl-carrier protein] reductase